MKSELDQAIELVVEISRSDANGYMHYSVTERAAKILKFSRRIAAKDASRLEKSQIGIGVAAARKSAAVA